MATRPFNDSRAFGYTVTDADWNDLMAAVNADAVDIAALSAALYPVGSIYINAAVSTNPASLLGFGTWAAFGSGRVMVGVDTGQTEFDTLGETGGAKTHTLSTGEMPSHNHTQDAHGHTQDAHNHTQDAHAHTNKYQGIADVGGGPLPVAFDGGAGVASDTVIAATATNQAATATNQNTTATNQATGGGGAHNNLQPYVTVYMWRRTA